MFRSEFQVSANLEVLVLLYKGLADLSNGLVKVAHLRTVVP